MPNYKISNLSLTHRFGIIKFTSKIDNQTCTFNFNLIEKYFELDYDKFNFRANNKLCTLYDYNRYYILSKVDNDDFNPQTINFNNVTVKNEIATLERPYTISIIDNDKVILSVYYNFLTNDMNYINIQLKDVNIFYDSKGPIYSQLICHNNIIAFSFDGNDVKSHTLIKN